VPASRRDPPSPQRAHRRRRGTPARPVLLRLPAILAAQALGLDSGGFALDAACASSLYAIKLACDRLQRRECAVMLAGGVNAADFHFLHRGFAALAALSPEGVSRPFDQAASGPGPRPWRGVSSR